MLVIPGGIDISGKRIRGTERMRIADYGLRIAGAGFDSSEGYASRLITC
jgi:hypothetical protein